MASVKAQAMELLKKILKKSIEPGICIQKCFVIFTMYSYPEYQYLKPLTKNLHPLTKLVFAGINTICIFIAINY